MLYDARFAIEPQPNPQGVHLVWATVKWVPRHGESRTITGNYLFANSPSGTPYLHDGADDIAVDLGLWELWDNVDADLVADYLHSINAGLLYRPEAWVLCRYGEVGIELVGRRQVFKVR